jgi:hypothetical protein
MKWNYTGSSLTNEVVGPCQAVSNQPLHPGHTRALKVRAEQRSWAPPPLSHQTNRIPPRAPPAICSYLPSMVGTVTTITKSPPLLVPPVGPTPGGSLPLSSIDKTATLCVSVDFIQVFPAPTASDSASAVAMMREGFTKALVSYYPVASRIAEPIPGSLRLSARARACGSWRPRSAALSRRHATSSARSASPRRSCSHARSLGCASRTPCSSRRSDSDPLLPLIICRKLEYFGGMMGWICGGFSVW